MRAMEAVGMNPKTVPIRGGTDGARLSIEGLPCPNLCTGGANYHGRFEYIPVEDMELCTNLLVEILTNLSATACRKTWGRPFNCNIFYDT